MVVYIRLLRPHNTGEVWMITSGWAQDSWSTTLLPHHQPIRRKLYTLQPSPQILHIKLLPPNNQSMAFLCLFLAQATVLLSWPCSKPFSDPSSDVLVCLASLRIRHTQSHLVRSILQVMYSSCYWLCKNTPSTSTVCLPLFVAVINSVFSAA